MVEARIDKPGAGALPAAPCGRRCSRRSRGPPPPILNTKVEVRNTGGLTAPSESCGIEAVARASAFRDAAGGCRYGSWTGAGRSWRFLRSGDCNLIRRCRSATRRFSRQSGSAAMADACAMHTPAQLDHGAVKCRRFDVKILPPAGGRGGHHHSAGLAEARPVDIVAQVLTAASIAGGGLIARRLTTSTNRYPLAAVRCWIDGR